MTSRVLQNIGLCRKAGFVIFGFDAVKKEMAAPNNKVFGIVTASDLSAKSLKEIRFEADKYGKPVEQITASMSELEQVLNKRTGIIAILDEGFYTLLTASK